MNAGGAALQFVPGDELYFGMRFVQHGMAAHFKAQPLGIGIRSYSGRPRAAVPGGF